MGCKDAAGNSAAFFSEERAPGNMRATGGYMKKHWRAIFIAAVVIIAGVAGITIYRNATAGQGSAYQTAVLARGTLTASIGATGTIQARQQSALGFSIAGRVGKVNVNMGEKVAAGDVLMEMDPAYYPQAVLSAQIDLINAQKSLDDLQTSKTALAQAELDLANAKKALDQAQTDYNDAVANNNDGWVEQAQKKADQAYQDWITFRNHNDGSRAAVIELARRYRAYIDALKELELARQYRDQGVGTPGGNKDTEMALEIAKGELDLAQAQYDDALAAYNRLKNGVPAQDLAAAQAQVDAAQSIVDQTRITAPFAGTILSLDYLPGDVITPGAEALVIADLSEMHVDVPIAEVDYNRVMIGQNATLVLDAVPDTTYHGSVDELNLNATNSSGSVAYPVKVVIIDADRSVLPGMTAAVNVEVSHLEDVLLVPNRAVRTVGGSRVVFLLVGGSLKQVEIVLGASNDTLSEVVSGGVKAGDVVVLNPPTSFFSGSSGGGPFGGGGGGGGGILSGG
jgi:HlyD family secretion protein